MTLGLIDQSVLIAIVLHTTLYSTSKLVPESESPHAPEDVMASQDGYPASTAHGES